MRFAIAHQTDGRTRLRALVRPVDTLELMGIADSMSGLPGVDAVDVRATTGSRVIEHPDLPWENIEHELARFGIEVLGFVDGIEGYTDSLAPVRATIGHVDGLMTRLTTGGVDDRFRVDAGVGVTPDHARPDHGPGLFLSLLCF